MGTIALDKYIVAPDKPPGFHQAHFPVQRLKNNEVGKKVILRKGWLTELNKKMIYTSTVPAKPVSLLHYVPEYGRICDFLPEEHSLPPSIWIFCGTLIDNRPLDLKAWICVLCLPGWRIHPRLRYGHKDQLDAVLEETNTTAELVVVHLALAVDNLPSLRWQ